MVLKLKVSACIKASQMGPIYLFGFGQDWETAKHDCGKDWRMKSIELQ